MCEKNNKITRRFIWQVTARKKLHILLLTLNYILIAILGIAVAWLLCCMIDGAVAGEYDVFLFYAVCLVGVSALQIALSAVGRFLEEYLKSSLENAFKSRLFTALLKKDYGSVSAVHSGEWLNRLTSDTMVVSEGLTTIIPNLAGMVAKMVGAMALLIVMIPQFGYIMLPCGVALMVLSYAFRATLKKLHKNVQQADGKTRVFLQEQLSSLMIVHTFAKETQAQEQAQDKMFQHHRTRMAKNRFSNICNIGFGTIMKGAYIFGGIYCAYGILIGSISYGTFTAVLQLIGQVQSPFANISGYLPKFYAMIASAERLQEAETLPSDGGNEALDMQEAKALYQSDFTAMGLKNAWFTYQPPVQSDGEVKMPIVIENLSLEITKGEYIAFTGKSGSGKSTILKLLMCLYKVSDGMVYIKHANGECVPLTSAHRSLFAYVPQGNQLMTGSIREIVAFGDKEEMHNTAKINQALEIACGEFVFALDSGVDTQLGERGAGLSEGQMQRIAIARAIFSDNPVLMLDECTSALDEATEKRLLKNLKEMTNKTVLIVTHRNAVLDICDRVIRS